MTTDAPTPHRAPRRRGRPTPDTRPALATPTLPTAPPTAPTPADPVEHDAAPEVSAVLDVLDGQSWGAAVEDAFGWQTADAVRRLPSARPPYPPLPGLPAHIDLGDWIGRDPDTGELYARWPSTGERA